MDPEPTRGVVQGVAALDLSGMSPDDVATITEIRDVALVLVPESLSGALSGRMRNVASVVPVPDGVRARMHTGTLVVGGDALAGPGAEDEVLVVTGTLAFTEPVQRIAYRQVVVTGLVVAPHGSEAALGSGLTRLTGSVHYFRHAQGQRVVTRSGQLTIGPETLANRSGSPDDVLVLTGQVVVAGPVERVGFQTVVVTGQLLAPRDAEAVLAPALSTDGQVAWYADEPRIFVGEERFGRGFFELLDEPLALALVGDVVIEDDVSPELIREAVTDITLIGRITAPREVVPVLQLLATQKHGTIRDAGERG